MNRHQIAVDQFMEGFRCSQAVLAAYAPDFDMDSDLAKTISLGLAGGSGVGGACGAVSGAYLVIALKFGFAHPGDPEGVGRIIGKTKTFAEKFRSLHGAMNCPELLGLDVFSPEGHRKFEEKNIKETTCARFVGDTINILEELLAD